MMLSLVLLAGSSWLFPVGLGQGLSCFTNMLACDKPYLAITHAVDCNDAQYAC